MIEAVIFDFDGVVLDSEPLHYEACCSVLKPLGLGLSYEEYKEKYLGLADKEMLPQLMRDLNYSIAKDALVELTKKKVDAYIAIIKHCRHLPIITGFQQFLTNIAPKVKKVAICSGSTKNEIKSTLDKLAQGQLKSYFDTIVTSDDVTHGKPSPEGYLLTAKKLDIKPQHCIAIEDTAYGIQAAKEAGMQTIGLLTSYKQEQYLNADKIVTNFNQLIAEDILK